MHTMYRAERDERTQRSSRSPGAATIPVRCTMVKPTVKRFARVSIAFAAVQLVVALLSVQLVVAIAAL